MLEPIKNSIPIVEEDDNGYWEVYKDAQNHIIKKVWHQNKIKLSEEDIINQEINMSLQTLYEQEKENRKEKSNFISLESGESFEGEFVSVEKTTGQFGERYTFTFLVNGEEKNLNSKSFKLLKNMISAGVKEKDKVKITKEGERFTTNFIVEKLS